MMPEAVRWIAFDAVGKLQFKGVEAYRKHWDTCLSYCPGEMLFEIHDLEITKHPVGSRGFFDDLDHYHFEKLHHLLRLVPYDACRGRTVLEVGCGYGKQLRSLRALMPGVPLIGIGLKAPWRPPGCSTGKYGNRDNGPRRGTGGPRHASCASCAPFDVVL